MKKWIVTAALVALTAASSAVAPAFGFGGPDPNPNAVERCMDVIGKQSDSGIESGGGPKAGIPAPTNCDHFFQFIDAIGNGPPAPPNP